MTAHAKYALRSPCIPQIFNLALAVATSEAGRAKCLVSGKNSKILDFVTASATAIRAIVADERTVSKQEQICVAIKEGTASVASEAFDMPPVARKLECFPFLENISTSFTWICNVVRIHWRVQVICGRRIHVVLKSPPPLATSRRR